MEKNDTIRDLVLRTLYERHTNAKGIKNISIGIRELHQLVKGKIKVQELNSNLDYLVQKGWVKKEVTRSQFITRGGFNKTSEKISYKISDIGIDKLEGASLYSTTVKKEGINITNIDSVMVIGDGNIVNASMTELSELLKTLRNEIEKSETYDSEQKLGVISDIDSIQSQLSKPKPLIEIVKTIWKGIENFVTAGEFVELITKITLLIINL